ncbi:hypothetical protein IH785_16435 [candidate division KSB1 bacterium]|nr:hypothetical protein [candidate division KSB1 bacterium]
MAATNVGALNYQALSGGRNQFEIRLNQHHRATFTVDDAWQSVVVLQIGGHTWF